MITLFEHLRRVMQTSPRHIGNVQQAIDAADINECAVLGQVLDRSFDDITDIDLARVSRPFVHLRPRR